MRNLMKTGLAARMGSAVAIILTAAWIAGCAAERDTREGAAQGAAAGAALGGVVGHQSGETGEGAAIGAAAGAIIGGALEEADDDDARFGDRDVDYGDLDYEDLMTEEEKDRVRDRANQTFINDWGDYLTAAEKEKLRDRADRGIGN